MLPRTPQNRTDKAAAPADASFKAIQEFRIPKPRPQAEAGRSAPLMSILENACIGKCERSQLEILSFDFS
jgi:hypothetical protein